MSVEFSGDGISLPSELRDYQWEGVKFLLASPGALLADEMGLGKTVQTVIALRLALKERGCERSLVIAPAALRLNWLREVERWAPEQSVRIVEGTAEDRAATYKLPVSILITSYEQLRTDFAVAREISFDIVLIDEAQRIKNPSSPTSLACRRLIRKRSWALSGTPLENTLDDLVAVMAFVAPGAIQKGMPRGLIHARLQGHFLRRRKSDVLPDLPPILVQDIPLEMTGEQRKAYDELWESREQAIAVDGLPASEVHMLSVITRLKQICNFDEASGSSIKLEAVRLILENLAAAGDKVLIFSQFVETLQWLSRRISGFPNQVYHGALSAKERDEIVAEFEHSSGPRALLISIRAGGVGLNLNSATTVIMFDRWWNPAVEDQAIQRAHRFGKEKSLQVVRFLVHDSIEERIAEILEAKKQLFSEYIDEAHSAATAKFSRDELRKLLGLRLSQTD